jgi:hypothetical protein
MNDTTIVLPGQIEPSTDVFRLALAIYGEARGEDLTRKIAGGYVIRSPSSQLLIYGCSWKVSRGCGGIVGRAKPVYEWDATSAT